MVKNDKLDALIMLAGKVLIEKNVTDYNNTDVSDVIVPPSLTRRIIRLIRREERKQAFESFYIYAKRIAAAILIICTISFAALMSVEAVRKAVWNAIVEFYEEYIAVMYVVEKEPPETIEEIKEIDVSGYGWEKEVVLKLEGMYSLVYFENEKKVLCFNQSVINDSTRRFDNKNTNMTDIKIDNKGGFMLYRDENELYSLIWNDSEYAYEIHGLVPKVTKEMIFKLANTIK